MAGFDQRNTTLDLNGPVISWVTQPTTVSTCGVATFIGIATATFPTQTPSNPAKLTGSLTYQWYYRIGSATTVGQLYNGDIVGLGLTSVSGSASTTLTVYGTSFGANLTIDDLNFFVRPDYVPSAYGTGDPITVGTARSTPNANNELQIDSDTVPYTFYPDIVITQQPTTQTIFSTQTATEAGTASFNIVGIVTGNSTQNLSYQWQLNGTDVANGEPAFDITVPISPSNTIPTGWATAGIYLDLTSFSGDQEVSFTITESSMYFHYIDVPGVKNFPENNGPETLTLAGGRIYGPCTSRWEYNTEGGDADLYVGDESPSVGGAGTRPNTELVSEVDKDDWDDMVLAVDKGFWARYTEAPTIPSGSSEETRRVVNRVSGATESTFKVSTATAGIQTVSCVVSHPTACNSPLRSDIVNLNVISSRQILNYELTSDDGGCRGKGSHNIYDSAKRFEASEAVRVRTLSVYAPEKDVNVKITMAAGAGAPYGTGTSGGEGGLSVFTMTMKQNQEYIVKLGSSTPPSGGNGGGGGGSFLYEGGTLLVAIGGGGGAGHNGDGGKGGGISVAGENGKGRGGGSGGRRYDVGQLPLRGFFSSGHFSTGGGTSNSGGRVSACTFGSWWLGRGKSACGSVGYTKFYGSGGQEASSCTTDNINRGYKAGIGHRNNGGDARSSGGGGGSGAYGGSGGQNTGGGGGSGYSNGVVDITSTQLGGNSSRDGYIIFEVV